MRQLRHILFLTLLLLLPATAALGQNTKPFVIPELRQWKGGTDVVPLCASTRIVCPQGNQALRQIAEQLAADCKEMFGFRPEVALGKANPGDISLRLKADKKLGKEGYQIKIGSTIAVTAPQPIGVYWATRTLLQMAEQDRGHFLPCGTIRDWPDYKLRGFMIDCGRKFIPMHFLEHYVKIMAYYKMNTLQIHLNDNGFPQFFDKGFKNTQAAFRLECDTYPGLTAEDGSYSKQEFIDLQKLAEQNFVDIIPEIDMPAHSLAFTRYLPEIESKGYGADHLDLFSKKTYEFVDNLWKEYLQGEEPVFRGHRVHVGTDEYSNKDTAVVEAFRRFTDHCIRLVEGYGKQAVVWGALTHAKGKTAVKADNVVMDIWYNGYADPKEMKKLGYQLISIPDGLVYIVPQAGYYYDYLNTKYLYEHWTPAVIGDVTFPERDPQIEGGMFAVWNDHADNGISTKDIHDRCFPAVQTLAVKCWTGKNPTLPYADFDLRRHSLSEAPGVNEAGRIGRRGGLVYEQASVDPGTELPYAEVGGTYKVSFDIDGQREQPGTELFRSEDAVFYLADPITGRMGYCRDGYLFSFPYSVKPGKASIRVEGNNRETKLFVNDHLIENKDITRRYFKNNQQGKEVSTALIRTLTFPLQRAGAFRSRISNLKVWQE